MARRRPSRTDIIDSFARGGLPLQPRLLKYIMARWGPASAPRGKIARRRLPCQKERTRAMQWSDIPFHPPTRTLREFALGLLVLLGGLACWQLWVQGNPTLASI